MFDVVVVVSLVMGARQKFDFSGAVEANTDPVVELVTETDMNDAGSSMSSGK